MRYAKPEVSLPDRAFDAIRGSKTGGSLDYPEEERSTSAYEADE
jgi:hypothetical protein